MDGLMTHQTQTALLQVQNQPSGDAAKALKEAMGKTPDGKSKARVDAAAQDFEAMFMAEMMKPMFEGIETAAAFGGGKAEEIFRGFMLQEYGKMMAETGNVGVADSVKLAMIQMQEAN